MTSMMILDDEAPKRALAFRWLASNEEFPRRHATRPPPPIGDDLHALRSYVREIAHEAEIAAKRRGETRGYAIGKVADRLRWPVPACTAEVEALLTYAGATLDV